MSGLAVAERLGADYPFPDDPLAAQQFDMILGVVHGVKRRIPPPGAPPVPTGAPINKKHL